jgi:hypothetical protein
MAGTVALTSFGRRREPATDTCPHIAAACIDRDPCRMAVFWQGCPGFGSIASCNARPICATATGDEPEPTFPVQTSGPPQPTRSSPTEARSVAPNPGNPAGALVSRPHSTRRCRCHATPPVLHGPPSAARALSLYQARIVAPPSIPGQPRQTPLSRRAALRRPRSVGKLPASKARGNKHHVWILR